MNDWYLEYRHGIGASRRSIAHERSPEHCIPANKSSHYFSESIMHEIKLDGFVPTLISDLNTLKQHLCTFM